MSSNTRVSIIATIETAFPGGPPLDLAPSFPWSDGSDAVNAMGGFTWRTAPPTVLDAIHDAIPQLEVSSFVDWLPGLLVDLVVDHGRSDRHGCALVSALTPPSASDFEISVRALRRSHVRGKLDEETYHAAVEQLTAYHTRVRAALFQERLGRLTRGQHAAVLAALKYLAQEHAREDAEEAVARWQDTESQWFPRYGAQHAI